MENTTLNNKNILKRIQAIRLKLNLTQDEVSNHLIITTKHLSEIERGIAHPSLSLLIKLLNFYNNKNGRPLNLNKIFYDQYDEDDY